MGHRTTEAVRLGVSMPVEATRSDWYSVETSSSISSNALPCTVQVTTSIIPKAILTNIQIILKKKKKSDMVIVRRDVNLNLHKPCATLRRIGHTYVVYGDRQDANPTSVILLFCVLKKNILPKSLC